MVEGVACDVRPYWHTSFMLKVQQATVFIQRVWRGYRARAEYSVKYVAVLKI